MNDMSELKQFILKPAMPVLMFPGQTSRDPKMIERILKVWPEGLEIVEVASSCLGRDIAGILNSDKPFESNQDIQVAVFLTSHLIFIFPR
jgi:hypothetical protein